MSIFTIGMVLTGMIIGYLLGISIKYLAKEFEKENDFKFNSNENILKSKVSGFIFILLCGVPFIGFLLILLEIFTCGIFLDTESEFSKNVKKEIIKKHKN